MSDIVIKAEGLGKRYRLGQMHSDLLSERLSTGLKSFCNRFRRRNFSPFTFHLSRKKDLSPFTFDVSQSKDLSPLTFHLSPEKDFWALKDVSFEIKQGEVVGIIGRNGAGKSTLLKILSRITEPTEGTAEIDGRVGSLLEVGTGFHPELTGRENIFLNGAILGMSRADIRKKFDEIVAFAEVEKFLDTPVKRYSSGMYVRLAFAVAAHLEPEILLVDEVLAVGDAAFQKKCLGKMGEVAKEGRTVLFVSHNMGAVNQLCRMSILLDKGSIIRVGETSEIVSTYLKSSYVSTDSGEVLIKEDAGKEASLLRMRLLDEAGHITQKFDCDKSVIIELVFQVYRRVPGLYGYLRISKMDGTWVMVSDSFDVSPNQLDDLPPGLYSIRMVVPRRTLAPGEYNIFLNFTSISGTNFHVVSPGVVCSFTLDDFTTKRGNRRDGFFSILLPWTVNRISDGEKLEG